MFTGDHARQGIIYPGFKGKSQIAFFDIFHNYLASRLSDAHVVIFIGFAFRDEHINTILQSAVGRSTKVLVINPDKSVEFPHSRAAATFETAGFGATQ